ncbi:MAG: STAS domain-containing protein [Eubacteriales bacterium]
MSLNIEKKFSDVNTIVLSGRLDTVTAPQLEAELEKILSDSDALVLDMANLEYISSAGLRVILKAQKAMNTKGTMKLIHVGESIMEVFDITGFSDFLNIEMKTE